jgi:2-methylisocitrate lyase-like PEP mutase family enzyme
LARRRADERMWAIAKTDARLMSDLQAAMNRAEEEGTSRC